MEKCLLTLNNDTFNLFKRDFDLTLNGIITAMQQRNSVDATISVKFDVSVTKEFAHKDGEIVREYLSPFIKHKIQATIKTTTNPLEGFVGGESYELTFNSDEAKYEINPLQASLFDESLC